MNLQEAQASRQGPSWDGSLEPDVWWSEAGIDALIWADPTPYRAMLSEVPANITTASSEAVEAVL